MKKIIIPLLIVLSNQSYAAILQVQPAKDVIPDLTASEFLVLCLTILMCIVLVIITLSLKGQVDQIVRALNKDKIEEFPEMENRTIWQKLGSLKPLSMEHMQVMEHKYDGIAELDNPTPPWFMYLFYSTIVFAVVYMAGYHIVGNGQIMTQEYNEELALAETEREAYMKKFANSVNENNVTLLKDAKSIEDGQKIYLQNCLACHGDKGQGGVGPNITDEYWLHGGSTKNIFHTITEGVPEKGMISWKKTLNPIQIQHVVSFMATLEGTKPANGKEPQGEKYTEEVQ
jgi:cytochrome c oxidase cbb3-type subunit III